MSEDYESTRRRAVTDFNRCWDLIEQPTRTPEDDVELLTCAFSSRYHWSLIGGPKEFCIADWMVGRVACAINNPALALLFAHRAYDAASNGLGIDWMQASGAEGLARAYMCAGDAAAFATWRATAEELVVAISDEKEQRPIAQQLAELPASI